MYNRKWPSCGKKQILHKRKTGEEDIVKKNQSRYKKVENARKRIQKNTESEPKYWSQNNIDEINNKLNKELFDAGLKVAKIIIKKRVDNNKTTGQSKKATSRRWKNKNSWMQWAE